MKEGMGSLPGSLMSKRVGLTPVGNPKGMEMAGRMTEDGGRGRIRGT